MENNLLKYNQLSDQQLQQLTWQLLKRYAFSIHFHRSKRRITRNRVNLNPSAITPRYLSPYSPSGTKHSVEVNFVRPSSLRSTPKSHQTYTIDQLLTIQTIFAKLLDIYSQKGLVKKSINEPEQLSSAAIKQFFLDCYACDSKLFALMNEPIKGRNWVNSELFVKCFEGIHNGASFQFFSAKKFKFDEKDNFMKLKMIFFYCVVRFEKDDDLDREALKKALNMVENHNIVHLDMLADMYLSKIKEAKPYGPCKISFQDYFNIVVNS